MTKSYQISQDMDIKTMPHAMYFTGDSDIVTKINHVPYQTIEYDDNVILVAGIISLPGFLYQLNKWTYGIPFIMQSSVVYFIY